MLKLNLNHIAVLVLPLCLAKKTEVLAQMPTNYITKVSYTELKMVSYEIEAPNQDSIVQAIQGGEVFTSSAFGFDCLNLGELSRYHAYQQQISVNEYVDLEGEILTEKEMLFEEDVRDEWMTSFKKILLGKHQYQIIGDDNQVLYSYTKDELADSLGYQGFDTLTIEDAANYKHYALDDSFYQRSVTEILSLPVTPDTFVHANGILFARFDSVSILYDHNLKFSVNTEYEWNQLNKKKEHVVLYDLYDNGIGYAPVQEIVTEWFKSENGCCLKKTTILLREAYSREVDSNYHYLIEAINNSGDLVKKLEDNYFISSIPESNGFMIQNPKLKGNPIDINIYDVSGRLIAKQTVIEGKPAFIPNANACIYLIEIKDKSGNAYPLRKVIKTSAGVSF